MSLTLDCGLACNFKNATKCRKTDDLGCGKAVEASWSWCVRCGMPLEEAEPDPEEEVKEATEEEEHFVDPPDVVGNELDEIAKRIKKEPVVDLAKKRVNAEKVIEPRFSRDAFIRILTR